MANNNIISFENRVAKIEQQLGAYGLPRWCLKEAEHQWERLVTSEKNFEPKEYPFDIPPFQSSKHSRQDWIVQRAEELSRYDSLNDFRRSEQERIQRVDDFVAFLDKLEGQEEESA